MSTHMYRDTADDELFPTLGRRVAEDERQVLEQLSTKQLCDIFLPRRSVRYCLQPSRSRLPWCLRPHPACFRATVRSHNYVFLQSQTCA